jgi:hypothetical protein
MATEKQREYYEYLKANPKKQETVSEWIARIANDEWSKVALSSQFYRNIRPSNRFDLKSLGFYGKELSTLLALRNPDSDVDVVTDTTTQGYKDPIVLSALSGGKIMTLNEYCDYWNLPREDVHSAKLVTHTGTPYWNIAFKERMDSSLSEVDFEGIIENTVRKYILPVPPIEMPWVPPLIKKTASRLVFTDVHVGMDPNPEGLSPYGGKWDEEALHTRFMYMVDYVKEYGAGDTLVIDDLGDYMDGWDAYTTRGGHKLPQNMSTEKAFDTGVEAKVFLIEALLPEFTNVIVNNVCNDNHSGTFGYLTNSAVKKILEAKYPGRVQVNNIRKFMGHYKILDRVYILCHGKDEQFMKFGLAVEPKPAHIEMIDQYIKQNGLYGESSKITFCKGDSHQCVFNYAISDDFDYLNYPAFSPSSGYVQTNFKRGRSGFVLENIVEESSAVDTKLEWFDWEN